MCVRACARGTNLIYDSTILMKKRLYPALPFPALASREECDTPPAVWTSRLVQCSKAKFNAAVVFEHSVFLMGQEGN